MTAWLLANMAWASLFMLLLLAIRRPFARLFGAGAAYALWLVPALRLAMPPLPSFAPDLPAIVPPETLVIWVGDAAAPLPPDGGPGQWVPWMLALWAGGAAIFLAWQFLSYRRFLTELSLSSRSVGAHRGLLLVESAAVQGPVALGLLDRRIVVPADFATRYSPEERRLALDHEAIHHRRGDIWWNHLGLFILALNWFNPVAWLAFRAFRADQELACDARVTAAASPGTRHDYARALIKSASRPGLIAACPLNHADQLKRRLKMMKDHKVSRARMLAGAAATAALAGLGLALGTPGFAQPDPQPQEKAQPREERREERTIIRTYRHDSGDAAAHREHHADGASDGDRQRVIVMTHRGGDGHGAPDVRVHGPHGDVMDADCRDAQATNVDETADGERTRIVLCSRGDATPAERVERLQRVRDRLAGDSELSAEQKARVTAALDREIARLRGN
ncbi:MAG: bla regulator protein blaR1 [Sphingomonadales bacterium]|nr:bla regulator protein blaR1 [Sphingomonadales bacterium]